MFNTLNNVIEGTFFNKNYNNCNNYLHVMTALTFQLKVNKFVNFKRTLNAAFDHSVHLCVCQRLHTITVRN